jgi:toxin CptA
MFSLQVQPSRRLRAVRVTLLAFAVAAVLLADLPPGVQFGGLVVMALYFWADWLMQFLSRARSAPAPTATVGAWLKCHDDGRLTLSQSGQNDLSDQWHPVAVQPDTFVSPWLTVLRYRLPGQRWSQSLVILPDSLPADDFRRLRVWLKWKAQTGEQPAELSP